ncbi:helix-turn-helix domain-containing protein [Burkholderia anthina]|uniref:helix-turn-helix domain-containing protein n=1 Tax=Burkholderia anthina TaxID=179879 RepID=UPI0037C18B2C
MNAPILDSFSLLEGKGMPLPAEQVAFSTFKDVHEQARGIDGWKLDYTQISCGRFEGNVKVARLGGVRLVLEQRNKVILSRGSTPSNRLVVTVPLELEGHSCMCGEKSNRDSLHVFSSSPNFEFYSPERHVLVNVEVDIDQLSNTLLTPLAERLRAEAHMPVVPMTPDVAESLRALVNLGLQSSTMGTSSSAEHASRSKLMEQTILFGVSEVMEANASSDNGSREIKHWATVNLVRERLENPETCPLSIAELCVQLRLSRRTVQNAFQQALDINPIAYLRAVRLNYVKRDLRLGQSVTEAALRWGFFQLGAFAQDYRRMFGELPSETARKQKHLALTGLAADVHQ